MPEMPPTEQLDFLLENGDRYVILGTGERIRPEGKLSRDAGVCFVAGTARKGGIRIIGRDLPPGRPVLDPSHRWLGIVDYKKPTLQTFDLTRSLSPAFRFQSPGLKGHVAIHPEGDLVATRERDHIRLHGPDGQLIRSARFPRSGERWASESFEFSACGGFLWLALTPPDGKAVLLLLRCPSLEVCDSRPPAWESENPYEQQPDSWTELTTATNPVTGHLAIRRQAGDDFINLHFYVAKKGKIHLSEEHDPTLMGVIPGETVWTPVFSPDGKRFLLLDSDGYLHEFSFPACRHLAVVQQGDLRQDRDDYETRITSYGYSDRFALACLGDDLLLLRPGDLAWSPHALPGSIEILPNGLLLDRYSNVNDVWQAHHSGHPFPVITALDARTNRVTAIFRKTRSQWKETGEFEVGWVETNFAVAQ
jgi:hypothetical protein